MAKTTIEDVAKKARMGKASIYYYFKNKESIYKEMIQKEGKTIQEKIRIAINKENDPHDKLFAYFITHILAVKERANYYSVLKDRYFEHYSFIEKERTAYDVFEKTTVSHILQEGVQKCIFDIKDVRLMAEIIVVALKGLELSWTIEKTEFEIKKLLTAAKIGTRTIRDIQDFCINTPDATEKDLSFIVRKKIADYGGDDVAFEPLVANSSRAHEIHQYPFASDQRFGLAGLALIDFGAKYQGYNSDITVPISFGKLSDEQNKMRELTIKSYEAAIEMIDIDVSLWKIHDTAEQILKKGGYSMPYSLGHGLGLTVHDSPSISRKPTDEYSKKHWKEETIQDGMVFTIEPGAYKQGLGGQRLENDILIRNGKIEIITKSEPLDF